MKKNVFTTLLLIMLSLLISCNPGPDVQEETVSIPKAIESTIGQLGNVSKIYPERNAKTTRNLNENMLKPEITEVNGIKMNNYHLLAEYDEVTGKQIDYILSKLKSYDDKRKPTDSFEVQTKTGKIYVEFNLYFNMENDKLSLISIKYYDNPNSSTATKETTFSPDYLYDILNQIKLIDNSYVGFDWIKRIEYAADKYEEIENPADYPSFRNPSKAWIRKDIYGNISKRRHNDCSYIAEIELSNEDKELFNRTGTSKYWNFHINGFPDASLDEKKAYVILNKYPENYLSAWEITFYWYENKAWNESIRFQADDNFNLKIWKPVTQETDKSVAKILTDLSKIGTINAAYQEYIGDKPITNVWGEKILGSYTVEFNSIEKDAIYKIAKHNNEKYKPIGRHNKDVHGYLKDDTILTMKFFMREDKDNQITFSVAIMHKSTKPYEGNSWYTSFTYLPANEDFSIINDIEVEKVSSKPDSNWEGGTGAYSMRALPSDSPIPAFRTTTTRRWQVYIDGNPSKYSGEEYIEEFIPTEDDKQFFTENYNEMLGNSLKIHELTLREAPKDKAYVLIKDYPSNFRSEKELWFFWNDNGLWKSTYGRFALEDYTFKYGEPVKETDSDFNSFKDNLSKLGKITNTYQEYAGDKPVTEFYGEPYKSNYVVEFDSYKNDLVKVLGDYNIDKAFVTSIGPVKSDTRLVVEVLTNTDGQRKIVISYNDGANWYTASSICNEDLSIINNIDIKTGKAISEWNTKYWDTMYTLLDKSKYPKLGEPSRAWIYTDMEGNPRHTRTSKYRYILEFSEQLEGITALEKNKDYDTDELYMLRAINKTPAQNKFYVSIQQYPDGYIYYSSIRIAWHKGDKWNYTKEIFTDDKFNFIDGFIK